jgi:hypothetical protein
VQGRRLEYEGSRLGTKQYQHFRSQMFHWLYLHYIASLVTLLFSVLVVRFFPQQNLRLFYLTFDCVMQTVVLILCHVSLWCDSDDLISLTSLQGWILLLVSQAYIVDIVFQIAGLNRLVYTITLGHINF